MATEIRPFREDELLRFAQIRQESYHLGFDGTVLNPHLTDPTSSRCVFVDGVMQATGRLYEFTQSLHGQRVAMGGIASIAVPMEERRKGHIRTLLMHLLAEMRDRAMPVSALYPSTFAFYRQFGYEIAAQTRTLTLSVKEPYFDRTLALESGTIKRMTDADIPVVKELYERYAKLQQGALFRDDLMWEQRRFHTVADGYRRPCYIWYDAQGAPQGYMLWDRIKDDVLNLFELVYTNVCAWLELLRFTQRDNLLEQVTWKTSADSMLPTLLHDPKIGGTLQPGFMARIVDVQQAWNIHSPQAQSGQVILHVADATCDWNEGAWSVTVEDGCATVSRTTQAPHASADIRTWSQLFYGFLTVEEAMFMGHLHLHDTRALPFLKQLWATERRPLMLDYF